MCGSIYAIVPMMLATFLLWEVRPSFHFLPSSPPPVLLSSSRVRCEEAERQQKLGLLPMLPTRATWQPRLNVERAGLRPPDVDTLYIVHGAVNRLLWEVQGRLSPENQPSGRGSGLSFLGSPSVMCDDEDLVDLECDGVHRLCEDCGTELARFGLPYFPSRGLPSARRWCAGCAKDIRRKYLARHGRAGEGCVLPYASHALRVLGQLPSQLATHCLSLGRKSKRSGRASVLAGPAPPAGHAGPVFLFLQQTHEETLRTGKETLPCAAGRPSSCRATAR